MKAAKRSLKSTLRKFFRSGYLQSFCYVALATATADFAFGLVPEASLTLIYLIAVLVSAQRYGLWQAVMASGFALLAWDFFFTQPYFSLALSSERDLFTLVFFMVGALIVSGMTAHIQQQNKYLKQFAEYKESLYTFIQALAASDTPEKLATHLISFISKQFDREVSVFLNSREAEEMRVFPPEALTLMPDNFNEQYIEAELHAASAPASLIKRDAIFLPLFAIRGRIGAIRIPGTLSTPLSPEERTRIEALLSQTSVAIERIWLTQEHEASKIEVETERIRNALLISISHDLKTPLTTIIGSLSTLELIDPASRNVSEMELNALALTEAQRLERFITNLLDMTKLEFGGLNFRFSTIDIQDVIVSAVQRSETILAGHQVDVDVQSPLPFVMGNFDLLEQVLFNIIDNAAKYSPANTRIEIRSFLNLDRVVITISDEGIGISNELFKSLFSKFARASLQDSNSPGTGLGLAIAKGFLEAQGGTIMAANREDRRGAIFTIELPAAPASPVSTDTP